jgi:hypothetical protein
MKIRLTALRPALHFDRARRATACDGDAVEIDNESLIFQGRSPAGKSDPSHCEDIAATGRLNALFANSVNSHVMSMVNFSCCVCCAPNVTREVTAQPTRSAVRMEAWVHAGV